MSASFIAVFFAYFLRDSLAIDSHTIVSSNEPKPEFCIREATLRQSVLVGKFGNGSCALWNLWSTNFPATSHLPLFKMLDNPDKGLLLLKTYRRRSQDPYHLLFNGTSHSSLLDRGNGHAFRSPLVDLVPSPFSHVHVVLCDQSGDVVNLTFSMPSNRSVADENAWFTKEQLLDAFPWSVKDLRSENVDQFSASGNKNLKRHFYIRVLLRRSCRQFGYLLITAKSVCDWESHDVKYSVERSHRSIL